MAKQERTECNNMAEQERTVLEYGLVGEKRVLLGPAAGQNGQVIALLHPPDPTLLPGGEGNMSKTHKHLFQCLISYG